MYNYKQIFSLLGLAILIAPLAVATVPVSEVHETDDSPEGWWSDTTVDRNQNKIGDMVELHMDNPIFLDEKNTTGIKIIINSPKRLNIYNKGYLGIRNSPNT